MKIEFSTLADGDLEDIAHYTLLHFGREQMNTYLHIIDQTLQHIAHYPHMGNIRTDLMENCLTFPVKEHVIYYQPTTSAIYIVRILHHKMDPHHHSLQ